MDNRKEYKRKIKQLSEDMEMIKRIDAVNNKLRKYNWVFIHPYNQGFEVSSFERLIQNTDNKDIEELIFEKFARKFLNLVDPIIMLEGYYKKRPFIKEFSTQIEESIILCLQKDFSGAVSLLIPVIEGSIRKYLIFRNGETAKTKIKMSDLLVAFDYMTEDYVDFHKDGLIEGYAEHFFDINQQNQILKKHREYFSLWVKQLADYLNYNLFFNTRSQVELQDDFNRHAIFHGFYNVNHNFKNYLRLFSCLNFLSWIIGQISKGCSILADVEDELLHKKWLEYYKLLTISEAMDDTKSKILGREIESFAKYIDKSFLKPMPISKIFIKQLLKMNVFLIKK